MSAIKEEAPDLLQAAGPHCGINTADYVRLSNTKTLGGPYRDRDVFKLMTAEKLWMKIPIFPDIPIPRHDQAVSGPFSNDRQVRTRPNNHRLTAFNDPRFFCRDFFNGVTQKLLMIDADAGYNGHILFDYIRRIEPAAKSNFKDCKLHTIAEIKESHGGDEFEICRGVKEILRIGSCVSYGTEDQV